MISTIAAILAAIVSLVVLLGILLAIGFFVTIMAHGQLSLVAPEAELAALSPTRRKWVAFRALIGVGLFWALLLAAGNTTTRGKQPDGYEFMAMAHKFLRRFAGLPATPPGSIDSDTTHEATVARSKA